MGLEEVQKNLWNECLLTIALPEHYENDSEIVLLIMLNSLFTVSISAITPYGITHLDSLRPKLELKTIGVSAIFHFFTVSSQMLLILQLYTIKVEKI